MTLNPYFPVEENPENFEVRTSDELLVKNVSVRHCIEKIIETKKQYRLTPQQNRYVDKRVREWLRLQVPKAPKRLPDFLNPAEVYHLLEIAMQNNPNDALLIEFLIKTGLRVSEATNLLVQYIDPQTNQLKVVAGKGAKDRYVPLTNNLLHKVKLSLNGRQTGYLFAKTNGTKYTTRALQKKVEKYLRQCNFSKKLSTHSLRHTFACLCLSKGMSLESLKLMMGHSTVKVTEIYAKLELGSVKQQFLQLME